MAERAGDFFVATSGPRWVIGRVSAFRFFIYFILWWSQRNGLIANIPSLSSWNSPHTSLILDHFAFLAGNVQQHLPTDKLLSFFWSTGIWPLLMVHSRSLPIAFTGEKTFHSVVRLLPVCRSPLRWQVVRVLFIRILLRFVLATCFHVRLIYALVCWMRDIRIVTVEMEGCCVLKKRRRRRALVLVLLPAVVVFFHA